GMSLSPPAGTYLILFNGQYGLAASAPVSTQQGVIDLTAAYNALMAISATNTTHGPIFGNGETLSPGVYDLPAAVSLAATLTMDGGGDTNSVFIIRMVGALTTGALTTVVLSNGARARNIFWVCEAAIAMAATTIMKGTLISHAGAVSMAAGSNLEGSMFSLVGAISMGPGTITRPVGPSYIDLGVLSTFVLFTAAGAIANTGSSMITGDVGTNAGAIAGFDDIDGNIYGPGAAPIPVNNSLVTFSLYQNGLQVANSSRTVDINTSFVALQAMGTVTAGQSFEIRWRVDTGGVFIGNRILSLIRVAQ
ncbi:MAG: ice-binding family protein, partial [Saprospiraceae bacterium]